MAIKKSELYSSLWQSCDQLRGGMDASQYKDYVLVLLFVKYVSDKYAGQKDAMVDVPAGGSFDDMVALKGDKEIGDKINKTIGRLAEANSLKGVIDVADFNDPGKLGQGKEMVDRLSKLVAIFDNPALDFRRNRAEGDDLLGDAYEYLMRNFATESGKSKGQFYTPAEVSRVMARVIGIGSATSSVQTIYDPTCGSGSLLIKAHDEARRQTGADITIYGQEMDNATAALARMNMILHGLPTADIWQGNTLSSPHFTQSDGGLKTFDFAVANPPFSDKAWTNGFNPAEDIFHRFEHGIPPTKNGDYAFLLHLLASLKSSGKGAIIMPHGVLFRGNAEAAIRRNLIKRGYIKGIIGLPPNLFYGTGIPACIVVLDKGEAAIRQGIFMVDASRGFLKDGNKNRLRAQDMHKIMDTFTRQAEMDKYSRLVPQSEIEANDYNLNIPRYIDSSEPEDLQDIEAHLKGGLPMRDVDALDRYWQVFPGLRAELFGPADRPGYCLLRVEAAKIKPVIFGHPEFTAFRESVSALFEQWKQGSTPPLEGITMVSQPKALIETLSEDLLETFRRARLLDPYDMYQRLMDYWAQTMQDDVYQVAQEGWKAVLDGKPNIELIPRSLIVRRYFAAEQADVDQLEAAKDAILRQMEEMDEEHGGEEGLLADAKTDTGKLTKASVKSRLAELQGQIVFAQRAYPSTEERPAGNPRLVAESRASGYSATHSGELSGARLRASPSMGCSPPESPRDLGAPGADCIRHSDGDLSSAIRAGDPDPTDEHELLTLYLELIDQAAAAGTKLKEAQRALDATVTTQYANLGEAEIKALVMGEKWLAQLEAAVQSEMDHVSQALAGRIKTLAERYATPLPRLVDDVADLSARVGAHLQKMGFAWS